MDQSLLYITDYSPHLGKALTLEIGAKKEPIKLLSAAFPPVLTQKRRRWEHQRTQTL